MCYINKINREIEKKKGFDMNLKKINKTIK